MVINYKILSQNKEVQVLNVNGLVSTIAKRILWREMKQWLGLQNGKPIIIGGDFNATLDNTEKQGGLQNLSSVQQDFYSFMDECNLREIVAKNGRFNWTNRRNGFTRIVEKLDHFFLYGDWNH